MDVRLHTLDEGLAKERVSSRRITTLTIISCSLSILSFLVAIPLLEIKPLLLNPLACLLTSLHHGIISCERMNATIRPSPTSEDFLILPPARRLPLSSALPMIMIIWLAGAIWLTVSTINASLLGMSLWVDPNGHHVHIYLIIGVMLPMMEAVLLMFMVWWCLQERQVIYGMHKELLFCQDKMGDEILEVRNDTC